MPCWQWREGVAQRDLPAGGRLAQNWVGNGREQRRKRKKLLEAAQALFAGRNPAKTWTTDGVEIEAGVGAAAGRGREGVAGREGLGRPCEARSAAAVEGMSGGVEDWEEEVGGEGESAVAVSVSVSGRLARYGRPG